MIRGNKGDPTLGYKYMGDYLTKWETLEEKIALEQPLLCAQGGLGGAHLQYLS